MFEKQSNQSKGGRRVGAGRKKGEPNRRTIETQAQTEATGITPLEYMLEVMRDLANEPRERLNAAQAAAPYVHAKLSTIDLKADLKAEVKIDHSLRPKLTRQEWLDSIAVHTK